MAKDYDVYSMSITNPKLRKKLNDIKNNKTINFSGYLEDVLVKALL